MSRLVRGRGALAGALLVPGIAIAADLLARRADRQVLRTLRVLRALRDLSARIIRACGAQTAGGRVTGPRGGLREFRGLAAIVPRWSDLRLEARGLAVVVTASLGSTLVSEAGARGQAPGSVPGAGAFLRAHRIPQGFDF